MLLLVLLAAAGAARAVHVHQLALEGAPAETAGRLQTAHEAGDAVQPGRGVQPDGWTVETLMSANGPVPLLTVEHDGILMKNRLRNHEDLFGNGFKPWAPVVERMAIVLVGVAVVFIAFSLYHEEIQHGTMIKVEHVCCLAYGSLSVALDLSIKSAARANGGAYSFSPACAVVTVDTLKLIASLLLFGSNAYSDRKQGKAVVLPGITDAAWLALPGFVYCCENILVYQAIGRCPLNAFGVICMTMLMWNAVLWTLVFGTPIGCMRWTAIIILFLGCVGNQLPSFFSSGFTWGVLWAVALAFVNAAGGVAAEFALKRRAAMDINVQNSILYFCMVCYGIIYLLVAQMDDLRDGFFNGFTPQCVQVLVLQVLLGISVSRILKYMDAVTKTIVASFRGPGVIFFGAAIFHKAVHWTEILATVVVSIACYLYWREGPLVRPTEQPQGSPGAAKAVK